jgi:hypothetical protein
MCKNRQFNETNTNDIFHKKSTNLLIFQLIFLLKIITFAAVLGVIPNRAGITL